MAKAKRCAYCGAKIAKGHDSKVWDGSKVASTCKHCANLFLKGVKRCS